MTKRLTYSSTSLANWLVATVMVLVPFHAFLTVWASTLVGHYTLLRLWDEIILTILCIVLGMWLVRDRALLHKLTDQLIFRLIAAYVLLTLALGVVALLKHEVVLKALGYGLIVDLRFFVWLVAVWLVAVRSDWLHIHWKRLVFWPLLLVALLAVLQFAILPSNFLSHFGYDKVATIAPYTTINQDTETVRAQSFLRGPNPLGAYLSLGIGLVIATFAWQKRNWRLAGLGLLAVLALFVSFSRSGWLAAFLAVLLVIWWRLRSLKAREVLVGSVLAVTVLFIGSFMLLRNSSGVQDALLHVNAGSTASQTSNEGHLSAFQSGFNDLINEPYGRGPGTAGPASWYNTGHDIRNSEDYFLQIGQELGWVGLILFVSVNVAAGVALWRRRANGLALGLTAALIGLMVLNLLAYGWSDDSLAYIFWGLAGIALADPVVSARLTGDA
ncbi:MAG: O-antigen ligase family protein [Candidatus Saccharimonadales bacterium]